MRELIHLYLLNLYSKIKETKNSENADEKKMSIAIKENKLTVTIKRIM